MTIRRATVPGTQAQDAPTEPGRPTCLVLLISVWVLFLVIGVGYAAMVILLGSAYCEPFEGSSQYGELRWSLWPPGPTCSFTKSVHGFSETRGPTPVMTMWLVGLAVGLCLVIVLIAWRHRTRRLSVG